MNRPSFLLLLWLALPGLALAADEADTTARLNSLAQELRCLVCQNQSLADSDAPLAQDLRRDIREQLTAGATDRQVIDYLVTRYGDFVSYRPPLKPITWGLWFGPLLLALLGLGTLVLHLRRRAPQRLTASEADQARLATLLGETNMEDEQ